MRLGVRVLPKPLALAIYGAIGCLLGAVVAEGFLAITKKSNDSDQPRALCLALDTSGSMEGAKLVEVQEAASRLLERRDLGRDRVAVIQFSDQASVLLGLSRDRHALQQAVGQLSSGGSTNIEDAFYKAGKALEGATEAMAILVFTDGQPTSGDKGATAAYARQLRSQGVVLIAVATGDADRSYLAQLTGGRSHVINTTAGNFDEAFRRAEQLIFGRQLLESSIDDGVYSFRQGLVRVVVWTALLSVGVGIALVVGQNLLFGKRPLGLRQGVMVALGSAGVGCVAGLIGQVLFAGFAAIPFLAVIGRCIAWSILGSLLARGMAFVIPNLSVKWAWPGGAAAGLIGAICFMLLSPLTSDLGGRFAGSIILGSSIGLMVGLVEIACREAWVTVVYGGAEHVSANLGGCPVSVGSGRTDTVFVSGAAPGAYEFRLESDRIVCKTGDGHERAVQPGSVMVVPGAEIHVCSPSCRYSPTSGAGNMTPPVAEASSDHASKYPTVSAQESSNRLRLIISTGQTIDIASGKAIQVGEIPGLAAAKRGGAVALFTDNSEHPATTGLVNLSTVEWLATSQEGRTATIPRGVVVPLRKGVRIRFGEVEGEVG